METLASRIAREGGLTEIDAVGWAIRVAFSVEQIHALGGVHGRLSADGILIESHKCTSEGRLIPFSELPENVAYHSPERERGEGGSQADDTWAVAVILYLALSGSLPFSGPSDDEVRRKIRSVSAPPLAVFDIGDDTLQGIVDRALARSRDQRTAGVGDLRRELESWRPDACLDALPPLLSDDEPEDEVTMIQAGLGNAVRDMIDAAIAAGPRKPSVSPPRPTTARPPPSESVPDLPPPEASPPEASPSKASPMAEDLDEATLMQKPGIKLPGLVDDDSIHDRSDDPFAVPASRAAVPRISAVPSSPPPSSGSPASTPPVSSARTPRSPAASTPSPEPRRSSTGAVIVIVAVLVAAALAAFFWTRAGRVRPPPSTHPVRDRCHDGGTSKVPQTPPVTTAEIPGRPAPPASAATPASASASASVAPVSPAAGATGGVAACVVPLFPPESFDASTDFSFVCAEADPMKGGAAIRTQLVRMHRNISDGMREWALLGWYELAAFSVIRARCCPSPPELLLPEVRGCTPVPEVLAGISSAAATATDPADKALKKAVDAYTSNVYCIVRSGIAARFGRVGNPQGGEDTTFMRFLGQVVTAKR